jgi:hypothetical protein
MSSHCNLQGDEVVQKGTLQVGNGAVVYYRSKTTDLSKPKHKVERLKNQQNMGLT